MIRDEKYAEHAALSDVYFCMWSLQAIEWTGQFYCKCTQDTAQMSSERGTREGVRGGNVSSIEGACGSRALDTHLLYMEKLSVGQANSVTLKMVVCREAEKDNGSTDVRLRLWFYVLACVTDRAGRQNSFQVKIKFYFTNSKKKFNKRFWAHKEVN